MKTNEMKTNEMKTNEKKISKSAQKALDDFKKGKCNKKNDKE
tara:strand:- start:532 stop:657 length:126 start_codon:yes stop_codon:yes gene_type:complete